MIEYEDFLKMKDMMEKYKHSEHSIVTHPDNYELLSKYIENKESKTPHIFGMPVITSPLVPKDKIYMLSKDVVERLRKSRGEMT